MCDDGGDRLRAHTRAVLVTEPGVEPDLTVGLRRLCQAAVLELDLHAATATVFSGRDDALAASSGPEGERLESLRFDVGEGPGSEAFAAGRPVLVADLAGARARWPGYVPAVTGLGVGAVFAWPLQLGAIRFGVLTLYAADVRRLGEQDVAQATIFAEVATELLLDSPAPPVSPGRVDLRLADALHIRSEVYQAQGMVMVDLGLSLAEALALMRAQAFAGDRDLNGLAADIVARRVRLGPGAGGAPP